MYLGLGILFILALVSVVIYNGLISKKNSVENALSSVDVYLKKRADLIPDLVETVKQYAAHESKLLQELTEARVKLSSSSSIPPAAQDSMMGQIFGKVIAVAENYPDLKASQNFINLQLSLNEAEEQLAAARRSYNSSVKEFNDAIEMFPSSFVAARLGLKRKESFKVSEADSKKPDVKQLFNS
jgi:LemA protein